MEEINVKLLRGLTYKTSEAKKTRDDNGKDKVSHVSVERALKPEDILSWKDRGDTVVIVAKDGRKYRVEKEAGDATKGKKGGGGDAA